MVEFTREQQIRMGKGILLPANPPTRIKIHRGDGTTEMVVPAEHCARQITALLDHIERATIEHRLTSKANKAKFTTLQETLKHARTLNSELQKIDPTGEWDQFAPVLQQRIDLCQQRSRVPESPRSLRFKQAHAREAAWLLLYEWDRPITRGYHSLWLKLTTILFGRDDVDLYGSLNCLGWRELWLREIGGDE
jgi:hypothetical protein